MHSNHRLRILFLASFFPKPDNPWMGTWALTQAQALARQNVDLQVVSFTSWLPAVLAKSSGAKAYANCPRKYTWPGNVHVLYPRWLYYPVPPIKNWAYINPEPYLKLAFWSARSELIKIINAFKPDIFFCHHSLPNGWLLSHLPEEVQRPIITLDHDFDEVVDSKVYPKRKAAMQTVADKSWAMLAVAKRMENDLRSLFPKTQVLTQHNGIDPLPEALFSVERPPELHNKKVILSCALFVERKGMTLLIEAFSQVAKHYPDAILRIVGSGSEEAKIRAKISDLQLHYQVQMVGRKPHNEVLQEMVWADCFALVGWDEPFATVYLEAMAAGKPIICCQDGGITDVLQNGVHGYTIPPKDVHATAKALDQILSKDEKRLDMGKKAQKLIFEQLTWEIKMTGLLNLFKNAVYESKR
ncbi:MAG: glycosyltransferase [Microcoleaceae cyanobacterium]